MEKKLRYYQVENKKKVFKAWETKRGVMLQMPTGTGKTLLFVSIIKDLLEYNVRQNLDSCLRCKKSIKFTPLKQLSHEKKDFCRN